MTTVLGMVTGILGGLLLAAALAAAVTRGLRVAASIGYDGPARTGIGASEGPKATVVGLAAGAARAGGFGGHGSHDDDAPDDVDLSEARRAAARAAEEAATQATELMRRDFVANVSHELKSPVTAVGLLAEAVAEAADSPDTVRMFAQRMQRETTRLGTLITEIIALSALQGGGLHEVALVEIDEAIADAVDRATVTASASGITVRVDGSSGAEVTGDRGLLTTAIGNLVANAVHYSEPGGAVTISQVVRRGIVDIAVADTGIGIAPIDQRRVFQRFFRADPARSRATGGTGLGLAIVKHVAANHHGSIRLHSKVGVGSTFTLRLPLAGTVPDPELIGEVVAVDFEQAAGADQSAASPHPAPGGGWQP